MVITPAFLMGIRQALLLMIDTIERELGTSPRTSELRSQAKGEKRHIEQVLPVQPPIDVEKESGHEP